VKPVAGNVPVMKDQRLNIRASAEVKHLVEEAARATHMTASAFILQAALRSAQDVLADQTRFVLAPGQWSAFTAALNRPAREIGALERAAAKPSLFSER
jgi:uncharacterized protein (DUF1778 family)